MYISALVWGVHGGSCVMQFNGWVTQVLLLDNLWRQRFVTQKPSFKKPQNGQDRRVEGRENILLRTLTLLVWNYFLKLDLQMVFKNHCSHMAKHAELALPSPQLPRNHTFSFLLFPFLLCSAALAPAPAEKGKGDQHIWLRRDFCDCQSCEVGSTISHTERNLKGVSNSLWKLLLQTYLFPNALCRK